MVELEPKDFGRAAAVLDAMTGNNLYARAVVERRVAGRVFADRARDPRTFYIVHSYGMSLLAGDHTNGDFNRALRAYALAEGGARNRHEWMQVWPREWNDVLVGLLGDVLVPAAGNTRERGVVELNGRANFRFSPELYGRLPRTELSPGTEIVPTDTRLFEAMDGAVVPKYFLDSAADFASDGVGFSVLCDGRLAATAFSAYLRGEQLEIGIETVPEFRGKGLARLACAALIDWCVDNGYEPLWSCRFENTASYRLAQRLGFEPISITPYYRLSK